MKNSQLLMIWCLGKWFLLLLSASVLASDGESFPSSTCAVQIRSDLFTLWNAWQEMNVSLVIYTGQCLPAALFLCCCCLFTPLNYCFQIISVGSRKGASQPSQQDLLTCMYLNGSVQEACGGFLHGGPSVHTLSIIQSTHFSSAS